MIKIALLGKAKSGKDTTAKIIEELISGHIVIDAFANPLKKMALQMFPNIKLEHLYGASELRQNLIPETEKTVRDILLDIGKLGRAYNKDTWVDLLIHRVKKAEDLSLYNQPKAFIVSDLRMPNEFNKLKLNGFIIFKVKRNDVLSSNDISETAQDDIDESKFDAIIDNNGTLEELKNAVISALNKNKIKT